MAQIHPRQPGLKWVRSRIDPGMPSPPMEKLVVASGYYNSSAAYGLYPGDPLKRVNDGSFAAAGNGEAISHIMVCADHYLLSSGDVRTGGYLPGSLTYTGTANKENPLASVIYAIPVNGQIFQAEVTTAAATLAAATAYIGECVDVIAGNGSNTTGLSGYTAGASASFAASTAQLQLIDIPRFDWFGRVNDPTATYWLGEFVVYEQDTTT